MTPEQLEKWGDKVDMQAFYAEVIKKLDPETRLKFGYLLDCDSVDSFFRLLQETVANDYPQHYSMDEKELGGDV